MKLVTASVAVEKTSFVFDDLFDYVVPPALSERVRPGCRVYVPFGRGDTVRAGMVFSVRERSDLDDAPGTRLKSIISCPDEEPILDRELLELCDWTAERCFATRYEVVKAAVPRGILDSSKAPADKSSDRFIKLYSPAQEIYASTELSDLTDKQRQALTIIIEHKEITASQLKYLTGFSQSVIDSLVKKHYVTIVNRPFYNTVQSDRVDLDTNIVLSDSQNEVYTQLRKMLASDEASGALLYGVTGSGKTEVYIKLIHDCLDLGRGCIVMVPEISLTPRLSDVFRAHFGRSVAVFHSALTPSQRADEFKRVKRAEAKVVIGTRSAVFAPVKGLGLIVIDEQQEHTYKSESSPRYNAREVAAKRALQNRALLLSCSATPSVESFYRSSVGKTRLFTLDNRFGSSVLPDVITVDTTKAEEKTDGAITQTLCREIRTNLDRGEQTILLINRRGHSTFASCVNCHEVLSCPHCSVSLTYHSANGRLMCHYCGFSRPLSSKCPVCGKETVSYSGAGTQRIELELARLFPEARVLRFDADTAEARDSHRSMLDSFEKGEFDILLGTQMVSKGLDFHRVSLVGVLSADSQLFNGDYRARENSFDLLTQVVGRAV